MKYRFLILTALFMLAAAALSACEFIYILTTPDGKETRIIPGNEYTIMEGGQYILSMSYKEDHRNCEVLPEDTLFLVEDEKWRTGKDYLALELLSAAEWESDKKSHSASMTFTAAKTGVWDIQVIRECSRGGYKESLIFRVI